MLGRIWAIALNTFREAARIKVLYGVLVLVVGANLLALVLGEMSYREEARVARDLGYDAALLSMAALAKAPNDTLLAHARAVGAILPLMGFYLQPSVGGRRLDYDFWRRFCEIESVVAIKVAPFNRYDTLDVVRAVADSGRAREITLYTGNTYTP